jgi:hypothetical protein
VRLTETNAAAASVMLVVIGDTVAPVTKLRIVLDTVYPTNDTPPKSMTVEKSSPRLNARFIVPGSCVKVVLIWRLLLCTCTMRGTGTPSDARRHEQCTHDRHTQSSTRVMAWEVLVWASEPVPVPLWRMQPRQPPRL